MMGGLDELPVPVTTEPMEARGVEALPRDGGWRFEPKWDGFRCLAFRSGDMVDIRAKSGKPLGRFFPDVLDGLAALRADRFVLDGELLVPIGETLDFDALQARLHPAASRIARLARETPAEFMLFDMLADTSGESLIAEPFVRRRVALERFFAGEKSDLIRLSPGTDEATEAEDWLGSIGDALDGVVGKRLDGRYRPGERDMIKVKRLRTADCVVGGYRTQTDGALVASLLLGLYGEDGKLHHVGFTSAIADAEREDLTRRLEALKGAPGFDGKAPGGPSRWSTGRSAEWEPLRPELVLEVQYDQVTGDRFRHGARRVRWRPDKAPRQCTMEQFAKPVRLSALRSRGLR